MRTGKALAVVFLVFSMVHATAVLAGNRYSTPPADRSPHPAASPSRNPPYMEGLFISTVVETFVIADFDFDEPGAGVDPEGWYGVDLTEQPGVFFHVDDFSGMGGGYAPLEGTKSLWCGTRADSTSEIFCNYYTLPGYGNSWDQYFQSVTMPSSGDVTLSFKVRYDSEEGYDYTYVQYMSSSGLWRDLEVLHGVGERVSTHVIPADSLPRATKIRFRFVSDGAWSDQDGLYESEGAVVIDSITVSDSSGPIDYQDFENESQGDTATVDGRWHASIVPGYGDFAGVFSGLGVLQEDACSKNISGLWGFFAGSTYYYSCSGHPEQKVVPYGEERESVMKYLTNEIWSPLIDWNRDIYGNPVPPEARDAYFMFDMYVDNPLDALVAMIWHARSWKNGCPGQWRDRAFVDFYTGKRWLRMIDYYGDLIDSDADQVQLALGCWDMCEYWCGTFGTGECHSHAPLYDNVRLIRLKVTGPRWSFRDMDLFQDNFSADGSDSGTVRIDIARDVLPAIYPSIRPGDSLAVTLMQPDLGLDYHDPGDPGSGPAVYIHVRELPGGKSGAAVSGDLSRWPLVASGGGWTVLRMDTASNPSGGKIPDRFCVDLDDELYTPGDTILFYLSARDAGGAVTYAYGENCLEEKSAVCVSSVEADARFDPFEMTCLPANARNGVTDILYIDDFSGRGGQAYFDQAFEMLGIEPDRFDVRDAFFNVGNGPGSRVVDAANQIIPHYKKIIWNSGNLAGGTIGDGGVSGEEKSNDFGVLYRFLDEHPGNPGLYISGDNVASEWIGLSGADAVNLRNDYMGFDIVSSSHTLVGEPVSPLAIGLPGACFDHATGPDTLIAYGGCPELDDFDVLDPTGSAILGMIYSNNPVHGAVLVQTTTNSIGTTARFVLSGFSFHRIRDDGVRFPPDREHHLLDILRWFENQLDDPTGTRAGLPVDALCQNYPNPFNPTTTIAFSLAERKHVRLKVYNVAGQLVRTLVDGVLPADVHHVAWDGRDETGVPVASGVYFYRLSAGDFAETRKMLLLK